MNRCKCVPPNREPFDYVGLDSYTSIFCHLGGSVASELPKGLVFALESPLCRTHGGSIVYPTNVSLSLQIACEQDYFARLFLSKLGLPALLTSAGDLAFSLSLFLPPVCR